MQKEIPYINFIKYALMFLVVFGHCIEPFVGIPFFKALYLTIYTFHMPLFVFITGFLAKYNKNKCIRFLIIFLILQVIHIVPTIIQTLIVGSQNLTFYEIIKIILTPGWTLWFLPALVLWMFSLKFFKHISYLDIFMFFVITLLLGFIPYVGDILNLSRVFYFYPLFLLGFKMAGGGRKTFVKKIKQLQTPVIQFFSGLILIFTFVFFISGIVDLPISFFYGKECYASYWGIFLRIGAILIAILNSLAFMMIIPVRERVSKNTYSINEIGKRTLSIYCLHPLILSLIRLIPLGGLNGILLFIISIVLSIALLYLTSIPALSKLLNFKFKPKR